MVVMMVVLAITVKVVKMVMWADGKVGEGDGGRGGGDGAVKLSCGFVDTSSLWAFQISAWPFDPVRPIASCSLRIVISYHRASCFVVRHSPPFIT